jgi:Mrp family chromosome partitioning ATPase
MIGVEGVIPPPIAGGTPLASALRQAPAEAPRSVRNEQRAAETIVEDYASKRDLNLPSSMVVYHDRAGPIAEEYRKIRDGLMAAHFRGAGSSARREAQTLVITSTLAGEGKTVTLLNLGLSLVEVRANRVLLIDGCLHPTRHASLTQLLHLGSEKGLAEFLAAPATENIESYLKATPWHNLHVLPSGARTTAAAAAGLLQSTMLRSLLRHAAANFDWVLIDAPAAWEYPDAGLLGGPSDGILVAVALHHTPHAQVQKMLRRLKALNLPLKSCILTRA